MGGLEITGAFRGAGFGGKGLGLLAVVPGILLGWCVTCGLGAALVCTCTATLSFDDLLLWDDDTTAAPGLLVVFAGWVGTRFKSIGLVPGGAGFPGGGYFCTGLG